jgi:hypothetical protein
MPAESPGASARLTSCRIPGIVRRGGGTTGSLSMPLLRDKIIGHDLERLAFRFTMLNGDEVVQCQISDAAMDELAGMQGTESSARQAQFMSLRDTIEQIASNLYDEVPRVQGYVVRIFMRHLGK